MNEIVEKSDMVRMVVIDVSKPLGAKIYDEAILTVLQATSFVKKIHRYEKI